MMIALLALSLSATQPARVVEPYDPRPHAVPKIPGHPEIHMSPLPGLWVITGGIPERRVRNWIKVVNVGGANHPWSILYFAPEKIRVTGFPEYAYRLSSSQYRALSALTASQPCRQNRPSPTDVQRLVQKGEDPYWGVFKIDRAIDGKRQAKCFLLERDNCRYFSRIADMPIPWTRRDIDGVANMALTLNCNSEESEKWRRIYKSIIPDPS